MDKVYYIGFYGDSIAYKDDRNIHPAGVNKMDYIARAISSIGCKVKIVSPAWLNYNKGIGIKFVSQRKFAIDDNIDCVLPLSIALPFRFTKLFTILLAKIWLVLYVLLRIRKDDKVIVYHSTFYFDTIYWLRRIVRFHLILEVEEVYSIVFSMGENWYKREKRLIENADSYIFPNDLMCDYFKLKKQQQFVVYGSYLNRHEIVGSSFEYVDDKIHLVYAGSIDRLRLAAHTAINVAKYLNENYELHILGFGEESIVNELIQQIENINRYASCKVIFEGLKKGDEYYKFMRKCQIGLNTQKLESDYMKFAFPSKVLSYLSMGLNVVSSNVETVQKSSIANLVSFYYEDSPIVIAETIKNMKILDSKSINLKMSELDENFRRDLFQFLVKK